MKELNDLDLFLNQCWDLYLKYCPSAKKVLKVLEKNDEVLVNDHIAFRTLKTAKSGVKQQVKFLEKFNYVVKDNYKFENKKLNALHLENTKDPLRPKIFLSEINLNDFPKTVQKYGELFKEVYLDELSEEELFLKSQPSKPLISYSEYEKLYSSSEYLAWLLTCGHMPNHFTISINDLKNFPNLISFNNCLKENNFELNTAGGEIKGNISVLLEQSSLKADLLEMPFLSETKKVVKKPIPCCYMEFALRYPDEGGGLYQGFVTQSADKIFESTN